jgi:DNA repair protein RadC
MAKFPTCSGEALPMVRLALEKVSCLRTQGQKVSNTNDVLALVQKHFGCSPQEHFFCLFLNSQNEVVGVQQVSTGALDSTQVDPRVVLSGALLSGSSAIILIHNHPSGVPEPSSADIVMTRQLLEGAKSVGLRVLDHLVIGRGGAYVSMRDRAILPFGDEVPAAAP